MEQSAIRNVCLFKSDKEFSETVKPRMRDLDNPSFWLKAVQFNGFLLFSARSDMRFHSMGHDKLCFPNVSCVQAEILLNGLDMSEVQGNDAVPQEFVKHRTVVPVGSGYDERQRDAICVHQQILFASIFFPYP